MDEYKPVPLSPLVGILDSRTPADQQAPGSFFLKQNFQISGDGKLQTAFGFVRPYSVAGQTDAQGHPCVYQNWDYHNQGSGIAQADLEIPTLLFPSTDNSGVRRLYLATKTKILLLDEAAGQWNVIGSGYGADGINSKMSLRFRAAQLQNNICFVNAFDKVQYTQAGSNTAQNVTTLDTASEKGGSVTKPFVVIKYAGVMMIMNTVEDGVPYTSRIRWSDVNDATFWSVGINNPTTGAASAADYQDLDYGEVILGSIELSGYLWIFTDVAIWRCSFTVSTDLAGNPSAVLSANKVYSEPKNKNKCLWYPHTLVSDGDSIYYAGSDAIYRYNIYMLDPERTEWIYRASNIIFDEGINGFPIDSTMRNSPVAEYWPDRREIHFSWQIQDAIYVGPNDCNVRPPAFSSGINRNTLVMNTEWETCDYRDYGMTCYCNFQTNVVQAGQSAPKAQFFGISGQDFCLKVFGPSYFRQYYDYAAQSYTVSGYTPRIAGIFPFGDFSLDKEINRFVIDGVPHKNVNVFSLRIGCSDSAVPLNPIDQSCGVIWHKMSTKPCRCPLNMTPSQYAASNVRPSNPLARWNFLYSAKMLFFDLSVTQPDGSAPVDGGLTLSRFEVNAIEVPA